MFTKILIPASVVALGMLGVPTAQAYVHHHRHAQPTSLFASTHHVAAAHTTHAIHTIHATHPTHTTRSLTTHTHRSLKSRHIHASIHRVTKVSHTSKPLSEGGTAQPNA